MTNIEQARRELIHIYIKLFRIVEMYKEDYENNLKQGNHYSKLISDIRSEILVVPDKYVLEKKLIKAKYGTFYDDGIYDDKNLLEIDCVSNEFFSAFIHRLELNIPDPTGKLREKYLWITSEEELYNEVMKYYLKFKKLIEQMETETLNTETKPPQFK